MNKLNQAGDVLTHPKLGPGEWIVVSTAMAGGGTGHGPHDVYAPGHQLTLRRLKDGTNEIDWVIGERKFHQSGDFRPEVMLEDATLVRSLSQA
jgi:hypothetical protein